MSKYYGSKCNPVGGCSGNYPGWWCESDGQGNCFDGGVGDIGSGEWTPEDYHAKMVASSTRFVLDNKGHFIEVGLFLAAGCMVGDKLVAVTDHQSHGESYFYTDEPTAILNWHFTAPTVIVSFERDGKAMSEAMVNPALVK